MPIVVGDHEQGHARVGADPRPDSDRRRTDVLVIDGTGRGHALCDLFVRTDPRVHVYYGPGCPLLDHRRIRVVPEISLTDCATVLAFLRDHPVDFVFVSHIDALTRGYVDRLADAGYRVIGPGAAASRLEASKIRGKAFCADHGVPTAEYRSFTSPRDARHHVRTVTFPCVVKADGLTRNGDGSVVCRTTEDAVRAIDEFARRDMFPIVVERRLNGIEISVFALVDGSTYLMFPSAFDYKRLRDGDAGPNCDGMGSTAPHPHDHAENRRRIRATVLDPIVAGLRAERLPYTGFLYVGVMLTESGPKVLEINTRFGDSEAQVVLPGIRTNFTALCLAVLAGGLEGQRLAADGLSRCSVAVVQGHPDDAGGEPGWPIAEVADPRPVRGLDQLDSPGTAAFYANLSRDITGRPVTRGGRVLHVVGSGPHPADARAKAYDGVRRISFPGMRYRTDIGAIPDLEPPRGERP
ncbi:phosphoribosylamine--glycine ligase [Nocardia thraciensis]